MSDDYSDTQLSAILATVDAWSEAFAKSPEFARLSGSQRRKAGAITAFFAKYTYEYLAIAPSEWDCAAVEECCTEILPRKVSAEISFFEAIAPVLTHVLRLAGEPEAGRFVERLVLRGLRFAHTEWCFPPKVEEAPNVFPAPTSEVGGFAQAGIGVPGCVRADGVRGCVIERCIFGPLGNCGLELSRGCQSNHVSDCEFTELALQRHFH